MGVGCTLLTLRTAVDSWLSLQHITDRLSSVSTHSSVHSWRTVNTPLPSPLLQLSSVTSPYLTTLRTAGDSQLSLLHYDSCRQLPSPLGCSSINTLSPVTAGKSHGGWLYQYHTLLWGLAVAVSTQSHMGVGCTSINTLFCTRTTITRGLAVAVSTHSSAHGDWL